MYKKRLLFEKTGRAKYISHLDLLRTFQRMFRRADIELRHTEGFNPHPYMAFALPLSVGAESVCELLDTELMAAITDEAIPALLNETAPEGIRILRAYTPETKFADIKWLEVEGRLSYDSGVSDSINALTGFFKAPALMVLKKTKKGIGDFDLIPAIFSIGFEEKTNKEINVRAVISAQAPSLNPELLITAIQTHLPSCLPDFASFKRLEVYTPDHSVFR
jgi:radical SAM-linked protein